MSSSVFSLWWVVSSTWKNSYFETEKPFSAPKHKILSYPCFSITWSILLHSLLSFGGFENKRLNLFHIINSVNIWNKFYVSSLVISGCLILTGNWFHEVKRKIFFFAHSMLIFLFPISKCQRYGKVESSVFYYMEQAECNLCWCVTVFFQGWI